MRRRSTGNNDLAGYVFISPWLFGFVMLTVIPVVASLYISFTDYDLLSPPRWVGIANYARMLLRDSRLLKSLLVTLYYVLVSVPARLAFALAIAMLLNQKNRLVGLYRTVYYLPSILGGSVAISVVWRMLFGQEGAALFLFDLLHVKRFSLIGNPKTAMLTVILLSVWQFGSSMLVFLTGLKNIPDVYYEASVVDGASSTRRFFKITLPLLSPIILFNLIMQVIMAFIVFTQVYIVSGGRGGPMDSTLVYSLYLYMRAFEFFDMGYASGMAWILLCIVAVLTYVLFKTSETWVYYE